MFYVILSQKPCIQELLEINFMKQTLKIPYFCCKNRGKNKENEKSVLYLIYFSDSPRIEDPINKFHEHPCSCSRFLFRRSEMNRKNPLESRGLELDWSQRKNFTQSVITKQPRAHDWSRPIPRTDSASMVSGAEFRDGRSESDCASCPHRSAEGRRRNIPIVNN